MFSTTNMVEGYIVKGRLESEDIPVLMKGNAEGPYRIGPVYLFVPAEFEVQAKLVVQTPLEGLTDEELAEEAESAGRPGAGPDETKD